MMRQSMGLICGISLLIGCNQAPEGLRVSLSPEVPVSSDDVAVEFDSEASDKNGDDVIYTYQWSVDGSATGVLDRILPASRTKKHEVWTVVVTPGDGELVGESASASVTVVNSLPEVTLSLNETSPNTDDNIQLVAESSDADFDSVSMTYVWTLNGDVTDHTGYALNASDTEKGQEWSVTGTPNDGEADGESVSLFFTIGNSAPFFETAKVTPTLVDKNSTASCVGAGWFDEDGDEEGYLTTWFVNEVEVATTPTLVLVEYERYDKVVCELTAFDGLLEGNTELASFVVIQNTKPSLSALVIGPDDPVNGTVIEVDVTGKTDLDGDEISMDYVWLVDGKDVSHRTYLDGDDLARSQTVQLELVLSDGLSRSEPFLSNILTVANTVPAISKVTLDPTDPATDDDIVATVSAKDADRDTITLSYEWYVAGSKVAETSEILDGTVYFEKKESVYVIVTPSDSVDGVPVTSAALTVLNTPPAAPELIFDPIEPSLTDDVVCEVDAQTPDLDGDTITYTVSWELNGTAFTGADTTTLTGDTILAEDRATDDLWVCTITPDDGDEVGAAGRLALGVEDPTGLDFTGATVSKSTPQGGSQSGSSYDEKCGANEVLVGISGTLTSSPYVASMATRCAKMSFTCSGTTCSASTGTITTGKYRGGSGTAFTSDCPSGSVVTGFVGLAGWYMDQMKLRCAPLSADFDGADWMIKIGTGKDVTAIGGTGGSATSRSDCVSGKVATSAQVKASTSLVMTLGFGCQTPASDMP